VLSDPEGASGREEALAIVKDLTERHPLPY
jgi:hypothetical protein